MNKKHIEYEKEINFDDNIQNFKGYQGNPLIKGVGVNISVTPELADEYVKCKLDPIYFIKKYIKIIHVDKGLVSLELYPYQEEIINTIIENRSTIICTARQAGKTTSIVGFAIWHILFNKDPKKIAILANKATTAREILSRVQLAYSHLPKWLQLGVKEWNKSKVTFENDSVLMADATSSSAIRGFSFSTVIIDEAAHIENWDEFFTSVYPTISSGTETKIVLISTPKGLNSFYKTWKLSELGENNYKRIEVTWDKVPGRNEDWKNKTLSDLNFDQDKFAQEYACEFQGSSGTLIAGYKLKELVASKPISKSDNGLLVYEKVKDKHIYMMTCDVSEGKGLDYSAFHVIDVTEMPYKQVCSFKDNMTVPADYSSIIYRTAKNYNDAFVMIEINSLGDQVAQNLFHEHEYENILRTTNSAGRGGKQITLNSGKNIDNGIRTTLTVKNNGCSILKLLIEQDQLIINDERTINELTTFSRKNKSWEAEHGNNDDLVMGLVLFAWATDQSQFKELTDINTIARIKEIQEEILDEKMLEIGFIISEDTFEVKIKYNNISGLQYEELEPSNHFDFDNWLKN